MHGHLPSLEDIHLDFRHLVFLVFTILYHTRQSAELSKEKNKVPLNRYTITDTLEVTDKGKNSHILASKWLEPTLLINAPQLL